MIHNWGAFWTVVCLGLVQIAVTYYNTRLAIDSLPVHIDDRRRRRHRSVFALLVFAFIILTLSLAKLNDAHQYEADLIIQKEKSKQEALEVQLQRTLDAVNASQGDLTAIRQAVSAHAPGAERSAMLSSLDKITNTLGKQANRMRNEMSTPGDTQ